MLWYSRKFIIKIINHLHSKIINFHLTIPILLYYLILKTLHPQIVLFKLKFYFFPTIYNLFFLFHSKKINYYRR